MAKQRLDWFKLDCQLDEKMELIEAQFGLAGFAAVIKLLQRIYGGEGYYCQWDEDVAMVFAKKNGLAQEELDAILNVCLKRGIFDRELYDSFGILTSHGIQRRYYECSTRRKRKLIKKEFLLLDFDDETEIDDISSKNDDIFQNNDDISSTEEKRIEEKKKDETRPEEKKTEEKSADQKKEETAPAAQTLLTPQQRAELVGLSSVLSVEQYTQKIIAWQRLSGKVIRDPYATIKSWIEKDRPGERSVGDDFLDDLEERALCAVIP